MAVDLQDIKEALGAAIDDAGAEVLEHVRDTIKGDNDLTDIDSDTYAAGLVGWTEDADHDDGGYWTLNDGTAEWQEALAQAWRDGRDAALDVVDTVIDSALNA
jgi:hypothetical protein